MGRVPVISKDSRLVKMQTGKGHLTAKIPLASSRQANSDRTLPSNPLPPATKILQPNSKASRWGSSKVPRRINLATNRETPLIH